MKRGNGLDYFKDKFAFRVASWDSMVHFLITTKRFQSLKTMIMTMRMDAKIFENVLWKLCSYAKTSPDEMFGEFEKHIIKPMAASGQFHHLIQPHPFGMIHLRHRSEEQIITARTMLDMLVRHFGYHFKLLQSSCVSVDYEWLCGRFHAFDAQTSETFLALPRDVRARVRTLLHIVRKMPRELRQRLARTLVMQELVGSVHVGALVRDVHGANVKLSEQDELRMLILQCKFQEVAQRVTGVTYDTPFANIHHFCNILGTDVKELYLLKLYRLVDDEKCFGVSHVFEWQSGLKNMSADDEDWLFERLKKGPVICCHTSRLLEASDTFQRRLLQAGVSAPLLIQNFNRTSAAVAHWKYGWFHWSPSSSTCPSFIKECRTLLLCVKRLYPSFENAMNIVTHLARLHGIYATTPKQDYGRKAVILSRLRSKNMSLEPFLTRSQLHTYVCQKALKSVDNNNKRARVCCYCAECCLGRHDLATLSNALYKKECFLELLKKC